MNRRTFIASIVFALLFAGITYAVNPSSPFRPSQNIQDPDCDPVNDNNCYVTYGVETQANGTPLYTDTKVINFGSGLTATDNTNGTITITAAGGSATWGSIVGTLSNQADLQSALNAKQATLVSGTNIKTINGTTVLGSGDIVIPGSPITIASGSSGTTLYSSGLSGTGAVGTYNIILGVNAGSAATGANASNFIGLNAGQGATNASQSNFFGTGAGYASINATQSNFIGNGAGFNSPNASNSTFMGYRAGSGSTNGRDSFFVGYDAGILSGGLGSENAANSIFIGRQSGRDLSGPNNAAAYNDTSTFANYSILLGHRTSTGGYSNSIGLGAYATNTDTNQVMLGSTQRPINQVVINGTDPYLNFSGTAGSSGYGIRNNAGTMEYKNNAGSWTAFGGGSGAISYVDGSYIGQTSGPGSDGTSDTGGSTGNNIFIGDGAGDAPGSTNLGGSNFFGHNAGSGATDAGGSNFLGYDAGYQAVDAINSNFFGNRAGYLAAGAEYSNFLGQDAGNGAINSVSSSFIGYAAGRGAVSSSSAVFIGNSAGGYAAGALGSVFIGSAAGSQAIGSGRSIFIGMSAGANDTVYNTYEESSILIGSNTNTGGFSNSILLGSGIPGSPISNTAEHQFMLAPSITRARFRGVDYTFPSSQAAAAGYVLTNDGSGVLSWTNIASGGGSIILETNGALNGSQSLLNLVAGSNITLTDDGVGGVIIDAASGGGGGDYVDVNVGGGAVSSSLIGAYASIYSVAIGSEAGAGTSFVQSIMLGEKAGKATSGSGNGTFIGRNAGENASDINDGLFIGSLAGEASSDIDTSIFIGNQAGRTAGGVNNSAFIGLFAGYGASANGANFIGISAGLQSGANGANFIGAGAGTLATSANYSNFIGAGVGNNANNASYSNFIGYEAGGNDDPSNAVQNARNSIFIGTKAGFEDTVDNTSNGLSSILIGSYTNTGGFSNSILLGSGEDGSPVANTAANQFMLADSITSLRWRGVDYVLPATQAANVGDVLTNDGSRALYWSAGGGGGGGSVLLETNGVVNTEQALLNLIAGTNITLTDDGAGGITIDAVGGGGGSSQWTDVTGGINYASGIVGINNSAPTAFLDIKGGGSGSGDTYTYRQFSASDFGGGGGGLDDGTFSGTYTGNEDVVTMIVNIDGEGTPDTFTWALYAGSIYSGFGGGTPLATGEEIPITGGTQLLSDGISIHFDNTTGHTTAGGGDSWIYEISSPGTHYEDVSFFSGTPDLDDATFSGDFVGTAGQYLLVTTISNTSTPDEFDWQLYEGTIFDTFGGSPVLVDAGSGVSITGSPQLLTHGVSVNFGDTTGHSNGDTWTTQITYNVDGSGGGSDITDLMNARNAAGNSLFKITSTGMVGVGRSTPSAMLDIQAVGGGNSGYTYEQLSAADYGAPDPSLDDAVFSGTYSGSEDNVIVELVIDGEGAPDTFSWTMCDAVLSYGDCDTPLAEGSNVAITGSPQLLANGISVDFGVTTGHDVDDGFDRWLYKITSPGIFYYDVASDYWAPSIEDVTFSGSYTGGEDAIAVDVEIDDDSGPDTFTWSFTTIPTYYDNGDGTNIDGATGVTITPGVPQLLADGVYVMFDDDTGHTVGDHYARVIVDNGSGSGGSATDLVNARNSSGSTLFKIDGNGNLALSGTDPYVNFSSIVGDTGFGFRNNAGVMEFKNAGGSWSAFNGAGATITLQTDGVNNGTQSLLNLVAGNGITLTDDGSGGVMIALGGGSISYVGTSYIGQTSGASADGQDEGLGGNIFIGDSAGFNSEGSLSSIFLGENAGYNVATPEYSTFIGMNAGYHTLHTYSDNSYSNFIGYGAGYESGSGSSNFIGYNAGYGVGLNNNNFIGVNTGYGGTNAHDSNFIGTNAGYGSGATHSNFFGTDAGNGATSAYSSTFIGWNAGYQAENAASSIFIGAGAGAGDTVNNTINGGDFSILLGNDTSTGGFSNSIALGAYATNTATNQLMIGSTTRPINSTRINGASSTQCTITTGTGIACTSDERLKTNILDLPGVDTLKNLLSVKTVTYNWLENPDSPTQIGFLAQDLEQYFPELVATDADGYKSVYYAQMTPILTKAIQEMNLNIIGIGDLDRENSWREALITWMGSATNGITSIFSKEVRTDKLCVGETCVTESQLQQLLQNQNVSSPSPSAPTIPDEDGDEDPVPETSVDELPTEESGGDTTPPTDPSPEPEVPSDPVPESEPEPESQPDPAPEAPSESVPSESSSESL